MYPKCFTRKNTVCRDPRMSKRINVYQMAREEEYRKITRNTPEDTQQAEINHEGSKYFVKLYDILSSERRPTFNNDSKKIHNNSKKMKIHSSIEQYGSNRYQNPSTPSVMDIYSIKLLFLLLYKAPVA